MASGGFLPKRRKVEYSTNGEPVHVEVRTTLKGHRARLCVYTILTRLNEYNNIIRSSFYSKLKLLWALIFTRKLRRLEDIFPSAGLTMHIAASRNFNFEQNLSL